MRFDEIIDNTDDIMKLMLTHFKVIENSISIKDGYVTVDGNCYLTSSLDQLPVKFRHVLGVFNISNSGLRTLKGCPYETFSFSCNQNELTSLEFGPQIVNGNYRCSGNKLSNLIGAPNSVSSGVFSCAQNPLVSLDGLPKRMHKIRISYRKDLPLLKLLFVNVSNVKFSIENTNAVDDSDIDRVEQIEDILRRYLGKGQRGALQCAAELSKAGFKGNARL